MGEFEDYALLREFARAGKGVDPVPDELTPQMQKESGLALIGVARRVQAEFYAISLEQRIMNPAVQAILDTAGEIFPHSPRGR